MRRTTTVISEDHADSDSGKLGMNRNISTHTSPE